MFNRVEFCPRAIAEFASLGDNKPPESLVMKVRMHLLSVGWKIGRMKYKNSFGYKYISPDKSEIYLT
uniref:DUF7028 domain-containing protein n=1 Tax=Rhizophora mucronata TaxID=61149 RepID=A0A2P2MZS8_RHIMU